MEKGKNKRSKKNVLVLLLLLLVVISVGYAALTSTLNINGNTDIKSASWDIHFENLVKSEGSEAAEKEASIDISKTLIEYTVRLPEPGDFYEFTVDIVNKGSIDAMISEVLKTGLSADQQKYVEYSATYTDGTEVKEKDGLKAGENKNIKVRVKYRDDLNPEDLPSEDKPISLSFQVTYVQADDTVVSSTTLYSIIKKDAVLDNVASEYVTASTGIDFSKISSDTNGKGVYLLASTKDYTNPIYYYRGAVDNNNVKFANFCWKIVRTTETGGVKLIYNGSPDSNGACNNTGEASQITTILFNSNAIYNAYVGYMYGTVESTSYEETHKNTNNSRIKGVIDDWYKNNMTAYTDRLEDTVWCNDRSVVQDSTYTGDGTGRAVTMYGARNRLYVNKTPSLECTNPNDHFTVDSANGNGALTYPVAMLTADEIAYAGGVDGVGNSTYYLHTGNKYWALSPYYFSGGFARGFIVDSTGDLNHDDVRVWKGVRTSVSLKPGTKVISGDGTSGLPYIVN